MRAAFPIGLLSCALSAPILAGQTLSFGLQPAAVTVKPGAQAVVRLTVTGAKGNSAAIALSVSGLPAGIGADFAPKTLNGSGTSELRLRTAAALAAGRYSLQIAAKQGTQAAEQALLLEASPSAEFKLQAGTPVLRLVRNRASGSVKLEDHPEGRTDTALAVESAPSGVSVALASNTLAGSGTVSFAVTANRAPAYGRHLIRLKATSNAVAKTVDYVLVVDPPRFEIATPARARGLKRGGSIREVISVRSSAGFEGVVRLSAAKLPAGVTARFEPATVKTGGASVMILTASRAAAAGRIAVQVAGESGGTVQSQTLMLAVGDPDFDLTVTPATRTVKAGDAFSATVGIAPQNGFQGTVTLSASGLNAGSTVTFAPAVLSGQSDSQMEVRTSPSLAAGTYVLTITATSGSTVHTAAMTVVVSDIPTFAVFCNPQTHLLLAGYSTTLSVELDPLNGFNGAVQLSVAGLHDGVQSSFQPQSFAADSWGIGVAKWSTLTLTSLANLEPGTYPIAITAASADDVDVAEVSLIVARPLSAPWTSLDVGSVAQAGASGIAAEVGTFVLQGSGAGVTSSSDGFHYAFQDLNGNGEIVARVTGLQNAGSYSVAGVMIRAGLAPGAAHAFVGVRATGAAAFHSRPSLQAGTSASSWSTAHCRVGSAWCVRETCSPATSRRTGQAGLSWRLRPPSPCRGPCRSACARP
jgi:uncharacterized membrane protein